MTTGIKRKSILILFITLLLSVCMLIGFTVVDTKADDTVVTDATINVEEAFETTQGASVRMQADENGNYGLRFEIRMTISEYKTFINSTAYDNIKFGIAIIPNDYKTSVGDFTKENLFGTSPLYDLGGQDDTKENGVVGGKDVICKTNSVLMKEVKNSDSEVTHMSMWVSITSINPNNYARPFVGVGFVTYTDVASGKTEYVVEESAANSVATVADYAIKNGYYEEEVPAQLEALEAYLTNLAIDLGVKVDGEDDAEKVTTIKEALADYKAGETLDISAIVAKNAPWGYAVSKNSVLSAEIPYDDVAKFAVNYDTWANAGTTGNLALSIAENEKVSATGTGTVQQKDNYTLFSVQVNQDNKLKFDADFIQNIKDAGLNSIKLTFELTRGAGYEIKNTNISISLSVYDGASWTNKTIYATNTVNATATFPQTYQWGISDILDNLADGGTIGLRMAAGSNEPLNMKITHLEFVKQTDADYEQYLGKNIVTSALSDGIASWYNQKGGRLFTDDDSIMMGAYGADGRTYLRFDPMFIKYAYEQGYTSFNIKFTTSATGSTKMSGLQCGLYPYSSSTGKQGTRYSETAKTWTATTTPQEFDLTYTITKAMYDQANLATGDTLLFGSAGSSVTGNGVVTFDITHISFSQPA